MSDETLIRAGSTWVIEAPAWLSKEVRILSWVVSAEQSLAWHYGLLLTGFTLKRRETEWLLVTHVLADHESGQGKPLVAFTYGPTMYGTLENFALDLKHDDVAWKDDKYPPFARSNGKR